MRPDAVLASPFESPASQWQSMTRDKLAQNAGNEELLMDGAYAACWECHA